MHVFFYVLDLVFEIYLWLLVAVLLLTWLTEFKLIDSRNRAVAALGKALGVLTEPLLRPARRVVPATGTVDISPIWLIVLILFVRYVIALYILPRVF